MHRFWPLLLLIAACSDDEELTPLQLNQRERDDVVGGMRGTTYRTARGAVPEGTLSVEGRDYTAEDQGLTIATAFLLARQKRLALYEIERTTPPSTTFCAASSTWPGSGPTSRSRSSSPCSRPARQGSRGR